MKKAEKMTDVMLIKAFSEVGRNNYEVAIIPLWGDWLKRSLETTDLLEILNVESFSGYIARKEHGISFLLCRTAKVPFYEKWLDENELAFLDAREEEIEQLCRHFDCIKSDALIVHLDGMANYEAFEDIKFRTVDFDLKLIQEILTSKN
ncbi:hypothetical protein [Sphingobacterium paramultivorum]|uniref:hypothetical protein n=1 Tax=Sphingobacterium paramultivorum TaxID=2886510 RepID=UPI00129C2118|nr:hypothetical protein [Sphingobacterium paramultivorum]